MSEPIQKRVLPSHPDLDQYRKQARELLIAAQACDSDAVQRFAASHPRNHTAGSATKLADAHLVIAREHGFASWPKFKAVIESRTLAFIGIANAFVEAAISNRLDRANALLLETPSIASSFFAAAVVHGEIATVSIMLAADPSLVSKALSPRGRLPLLYATDSIYLRDPAIRLGIIECVKALLAHGADPNAVYREEPWAEWPVPPLYGAAGKFNDVELATILIDAGAQLDVDESLYHSVEHTGHECTQLLLERGAILARHILFHQLEYEDPAGLRLLLEYGADPNELDGEGQNALHYALQQRRSAECIALLIDHGVDPNAILPGGLTSYRLAVRTGNAAAADYLSAAGAGTYTTAVDRLYSAAASNDTAKLSAALAATPGISQSLSPDETAVLTEAADAGHSEVVRSLLDAGFPIDAHGAYNATALHWAAWRAHPEVVSLLIERGAPLEECGSDMGTTPLQWAFHAAGNNTRAAAADIVKVIDALLAAGAAMDPEWLKMAQEDVANNYANRDWS